jgi:hypothetical protein
MAEFSDEELGETKAFPTTNFGPRREFSDEEISPSFVPEGERGVLSNSPDDGWISSALKSAGTAGIDAVAGTAGMVGEAANLGSLLGAKAASVIDPSKTMNERQKEFTDWRKKEMPWLLDYGDVKDFITPYTGSYEPTSAPGRMAQTGLSSAMMAMTPGGAERNVGLGVKALEEGMPAFLAGAAAQGVGEQTQDPFLAAVMGLGASSAGRMGVTSYRNWTNPDEAASRVAGKAIRENTKDRPSAESNLRAYDSADYLPGMPVRSSTVSGDPGLMALDTLLGKDSRFATPETAAAEVANIVAGDKPKVASVVREGVEKGTDKIRPDVTGSYGISGTAPRQTASEAVRGIYQKMEEQAYTKKCSRQ